jgi:hypothetical protein
MGMRTRVLAVSVSALSVAGMLTVAAPPASAGADCALADNTVRTTQWFIRNRPDLNAGQRQAAITLMEGLAANSIACLVDAERKKAGRPPLQQSYTLYRAADEHVRAAKQQKWWTDGADPHRNPATGSTPGSRVRAAGWCPSGTWRSAENVYHGWGTGGATPRAAVRWWMGSAPHWAAILDPELTHSGISVRHGTARPGVTSDIAMVTTHVFGLCR